MTENNFQMYSAAVSDRGLSEKRPQNEDSFLEMKNLGLFAVADGVGGAQAGDVASQMAMEILGEAFVNLQANGDAEEMMRIAIERANSAIYQMSTDLPQLSTMATTIVALQLSGNIATIGHVGDSRLYRLDTKGSLYRETQDHSVVEEEVRAGRMTASQAANHPSRNVISRALGAESTVEIDMKTIMFEPNTSFLLCSDGITRHINDFEIRELLLTRSNPTEICQKMKEICYSRGAEDNLTAVIVNIIGAPVEGEYIKQTAAAPTTDEEATIATARQETSPQTFTETQDSFEEIPTGGLEMPASMQIPEANNFTSQAEKTDLSTDDDESYLMDEPGAEVSQTVPETLETSNLDDYSSSPVYDAPAISQPVAVTPKKDVKIYEAETGRGGGFFGKLLSSLLLLLIGAILGVAGYYVWLIMNSKPTEVTPINKMESSNPQFSAFEKLRREVDVNPNATIAQYEKTPPRDAADFYLLGRAQLLSKNYEEAKKSFIEARNKLNDYTETSNKAVLTSDITMGLVSAEDKTIYEKELKFVPGGENTKPSGTETNSATNSPNTAANSAPATDR